MSVETSEQIENLLSRHLNAVVATNRVKGGPQLSVVWYNWDGTDLAFSTTKGRLKYKNIVRDPAISMLIVNQEDGFFVTAYGQAKFIEDDRRFAYEEKIIGHYLSGDRLANMLERTREDPDRVIVLLHVEKFFSPSR